MGKLISSGVIFEKEFTRIFLLYLEELFVTCVFYICGYIFGVPLHRHT